MSVLRGSLLWSIVAMNCFGADLPPVPNALIVVNTNTYALNIAWDASAGADLGYTLAWGTSSNVSTFSTNTTGLKVLVPNLSFTNSYWFWVKARSLAGDSPFTPPIMWRPPITNLVSIQAISGTSPEGPFLPYSGPTRLTLTNPTDSRYFGWSIFQTNNVEWIRSFEK